MTELSPIKNTSNPISEEMDLHLSNIRRLMTIKRGLRLLAINPTIEVKADLLPKINEIIRRQHEEARRIRELRDFQYYITQRERPIRPRKKDQVISIITRLNESKGRIEEGVGSVLTKVYKMGDTSALRIIDLDQIQREDVEGRRKGIHVVNEKGDIVSIFIISADLTYDESVLVFYNPMNHRNNTSRKLVTRLNATYTRNRGNNTHHLTTLFGLDMSLTTQFGTRPFRIYNPVMTDPSGYMEFVGFPVTRSQKLLEPVIGEILDVLSHGTIVIGKAK
jgi:hypothetical protein